MSQERIREILSLILYGGLDVVDVNVLHLNLLEDFLDVNAGRNVAEADRVLVGNWLISAKLLVVLRV